MPSTADGSHRNSDYLLFICRGLFTLSSGGGFAQLISSPVRPRLSAVICLLVWQRNGAECLVLWSRTGSACLSSGEIPPSGSCLKSDRLESKDRPENVTRMAALERGLVTDTPSLSQPENCPGWKKMKKKKKKKKKKMNTHA